MKRIEYKYSSWSIAVVAVLSVLFSVYFKWSVDKSQINFMGGDAGDYYSSLVSTFIKHDLAAQNADEWYLLHTSKGTINVHPVGVAVLQFPFFIIAFFAAKVFGFVTNGFSLPFQIGIATAGLTYCLLGLMFLRKLFQLRGFSDSISALVMLLLYFGTNLMHYTLSEPGMSHVYSFFLISMFLFYSARLVMSRHKNDLWKSGLIMGLILLVRPNNVFILGSVFFWFKSFDETKSFFKWLFQNRVFYGAAILTASVLFLQSLVWYLQSGYFFQDTYKRDGFYWFQPHFIKMLFGFNAGFFVYTPLCLLFLAGILALGKQNRFAAISISLFFLVLFYFFSAYWAYTYFDGFGIRVLVDYYAIFGLLGAQLFAHLQGKILFFSATTAAALLLVSLNFIYTYQANRGIILRAGMNFNMWRYVFLHTAVKYQNCLGGHHELKPYSKFSPPVLFENKLSLTEAFDFKGKEYGPAITFDSLPVKTRRLYVELICDRKEQELKGSENVQMVLSVENPKSGVQKNYTQFKLNETPSEDCCETAHYQYTSNLVGEFEKGDKVSIYIWNRTIQPFYLEKLEAKIYDYNYQLN